MMKTTFIKIIINSSNIEKYITLTYRQLIYLNKTLIMDLDKVFSSRIQELQELLKRSNTLTIRELIIGCIDISKNCYDLSKSINLKSQE